MLMKPEKKSKKRKKSASTNGVGVTKGDANSAELDLSFKQERLSVVGTWKERDKAKMETKAPGESEAHNVKRKKERGSGKQCGKSSKDGCEDAVKSAVKRRKKLKNEGETLHDSLLDTKTIAPESSNETQETKAVETLCEGSGGNLIDGVNRKKRKKEKGKKADGQVDIVAGVIQGYVSAIEEIEDSKIENANIRKKKKTKSGHSCKDLTHEKCEKKVRFSVQVQVFPPSSYPSDEEYEVEEEKLLRGKRFSKEEDEIVKDAVYRYIEVHNLGEEGLQKVLNSKSSPEARGCWKKIGRAIPYRPYVAVYWRAQRLFRMGEKRKYTEEEYEMIRKFHTERGTKWKVLADELGKHETHVRNAWGRIKLANRKKGSWSQEEIQTLFDLVNADLQQKLCEEKKSMHGMLRDNISWSAISDKLSTRISHHCCKKWYGQLTSPMVAKGEWADTDDYRLVDTLFELDASCIDDVDWDNLLSHRPGELCRKRWNQMVRHISQHENKSFAVQVEVLAKRYRPDMVEAREAWDRKPAVP
ncbi:uncharacterized protein LOC132609794 [Lycium barbarum]|uniref:uncharacterized protein LOC132609794 n=1 Tax=Lycium barbarum TaxID=112863 RepID=UPI00293E1099|nr:uncharacterized protein LOC132609794 [Lycium barbarum]XP_060179931.1 uncharacterized protein LOC132609794 [Lycium barbarum]XP_060179932.1 uncharacterized protein LOC132609794 [Lycium barbarum]XP_060179933.1 uncharacterized protein LOC132609794 [Lycium barbarum]